MKADRGRSNHTVRLLFRLRAGIEIHPAAPSRPLAHCAQRFISRQQCPPVLEWALGETRGYDPHADRRRCHAAIARLAGRDEMAVADSDKKLEAVRENRKLKCSTTTRLCSSTPRQTRSFTLNQGNSNLDCLKLHVKFCAQRNEYTSTPNVR